MFRNGNILPCFASILQSLASARLPRPSRLVKFLQVVIKFEDRDIGFRVTLPNRETDRDRDGRVH